MGAMHKGLHRAYSTSRHDTQVQIKAVYSLSYHMLAPPCKVVGLLQRWLQKHAYWDYAPWRMPPDLVVQGMAGN